MAKEKWLINPIDLDIFQRQILGIGLNESYVIKGCAGSGKTLLALHRINDIRLQAKAAGDDSPSFTMIVYTSTLRQFIRCAVPKLNVNLKQIVLYEPWDASPVDYVIVDEVQDFSQTELDIIQSAAKKSMMLYGDSHQQIYRTIKEENGEKMMSLEDIAKYFNLPTKELLKNYRLPKEVAGFASHLCKDNELESRCEKLTGNKPTVYEFQKWEDELDYIIQEIRTRNYTDVAILLPFNNGNKGKRNNFHRNVRTVRDYFVSKGFSHEAKLSDDSKSENELDFDSDLTKVMTFHSSKGLQFETVFIPFCDYPEHDDWFETRFRNPFYVAITRTCSNLYLTRSERLSPFVARIPNNKYTRIKR